MPEGPEVRRAADRIERSIATKPLKNVQVHVAALNEAPLTGATLTEVQTYGKGFVLCFDRGFCIYVHLQLYGVWKTGKNTSKRNSRRTLRFLLQTDTHYAALYSATDISLLNPSDVPHHPYIQKLGPDILSATYKANHISRRLGGKLFARRALGGVLLDQKAFAGIGNYLRSEILFVAGIHPDRKVGSLDEVERRKLASAIYNITHRSYQSGGISTSIDYVHSSKKKGWTRRQYRHYVFARASRPCPSCGARIQKVKCAGRRLYLCTICQPLAPKK